VAGDLKFRVSGGSERELGVVVRFHPFLAMRASGTARLGAIAQGLVNDGLDGARASATFNAAAETPVELLGIARQVFSGANGANSVTDVAVAEDVAGTNYHRNAGAFGDAQPSIFKMVTGCKRKNRLFNQFQTDA